MNRRRTKENKRKKVSGQRNRQIRAPHLVSCRSHEGPRGSKCRNQCEGDRWMNQIRCRNAMLDHTRHVGGQRLGCADRASRTRHGPEPCRFCLDRKDNCQQAQATGKRNAEFGHESG